MTCLSKVAVLLFSSVALVGAQDVSREEYALKTDPDRVEAHENLLRIYCNNGKSSSDKCLTQLLWFIKNHPDHPDITTETLGMINTPAAIVRLKTAWSAQSHNQDEQASENYHAFLKLADPATRTQVVALMRQAEAHGGFDLKPENKLPEAPKYEDCKNPRLVHQTDAILDPNEAGVKQVIAAGVVSPVHYVLTLASDGSIKEKTVSSGNPVLIGFTDKALLQWKYAPVAKTCTVAATVIVKVASSTP